MKNQPVGRVRWMHQSQKSSFLKLLLLPLSNAVFFAKVCRFPYNKGIHACNPVHIPTDFLKKVAFEQHKSWLSLLMQSADSSYFNESISSESSICGDTLSMWNTREAGLCFTLTPECSEYTEEQHFPFTTLFYSIVPAPSKLDLSGLF